MFRKSVPGFILPLLLIALNSLAVAQGPGPKTFPRDSIIAAAREIIAGVHYCGLATVDSTGQPHMRSMNPFPPDSAMTVWMATNSRSRKVQEILKNPRVCLYYCDQTKALGAVSIVGKAVLVNDDAEKQKRKRDYWDQAFPDFQYLMLIKVVPERIEVINYKRGMSNGPVTWEVPAAVMRGE